MIGRGFLYDVGFEGMERYYEKEQEKEGVGGEKRVLSIT